MSVCGTRQKVHGFHPPNLDSSEWVLNGGGAPRDFYAAWESQSGRVEYTRFRVYEISYIISILSVAAIVMVCLALHEKSKLEKTGKKHRTADLEVIRAMVSLENPGKLFPISLPNSWS